MVFRTDVLGTYECVHCSGENDNNEWNRATEEDVGSGITKIEDIDFEDYKEEMFEYTCPDCGKSCSVDEQEVLRLL